jgi:hypothetical protein
MASDEDDDDTIHSPRYIVIIDMALLICGGERRRMTGPMKKEDNDLLYMPTLYVTVKLSLFCLPLPLPGSDAFH